MDDSAGAQPNPYDAPVAESELTPDHETTYHETGVLNPQVMGLAVKVHAGRGYFWRKSLFVLLGLLMLGLAGFVMWQRPANPSVSVLALTIIGTYFLILSGATNFLIRRRTRNALIQSGGLQQTVQYTIEPEWFGVATDDSNARIRWNALYQWKEGHGLVLLYRTAMYYQVVPSDQFSREAADALRARLKKFVG